MNTYQNAEWLYRHESRENDGLRDSRMVTKADDLTRQIADMRAQGYLISAITIHTYCAECQGSGRIPMKRRFMAFKPCKACKGHDGPISSVQMPSSAHC